MAVFNYEIEINEKESWKHLSFWTRPFHDGSMLDESLDFGQIVITHSRRREPYKPFTPLRISVYEMSDEIDIKQLSEEEKASYHVDYIYRLISDTKVEKRGFTTGSGEEWFVHTISTIEYSKALEREICDTISFTKYLYRDYTDYQTEIKPVIQYGLPSINVNIYFRTPLPLNSKVYFGMINNAFTPKTPGYFTWQESSYLKVTSPSGKEYVFNFNTDAILILNEEGQYRVHYVIYSLEGTEMVSNTAEAKCDIAVVKNVAEKKNFSLTDSINRILSICPTRRDGIESPKYILDTTDAVKYSEIEMPEFHITRSTLFEALSQIGGYVHTLPRLVYPNIITFDELGGDDEYKAPNNLRCVSYSAERHIDETCDAIDSTVENFICTEDLGQGAITEPCDGGWKSLRCDEGQFIISNDNALILTDLPIYRIILLELAKRSGNSWQYLGNIAPFIFESAEYKTLSSYDGAYPYSRSFALCYTQGDNKITELQFKQEVISFIGELTNRNPAIKNIIERIGGTCPELYSDLAFRVTYIPMTNARVKQLKPYVETKGEGNTLLYNQSANTVESSSYGENLKGVIARLGNMDEQRTCFFTHYRDLPKVGQLWDGKYIARIEREYQKEWIKATITLTEDFNRLAQYLGLHTNYRLYDVSEKQSIERQINYSEKVIIGDECNWDVSKSSVQTDGLTIFSRTITGHNASAQIGNVVLTLEDSNRNQINMPLMLPATSMGLGNSISFSWKFKDNYGAGYKSSSNTIFKRVQEIVPYGDVYGEFYYMRARLYNDLPYMTMPVNCPYELPEFRDSNSPPGIFDFGLNPLIVIKDSREQINITYQLHFVSNRKGIVIGSGLGQYNALVSPSPLETELFFSDKRLNVFRPIFPKNETGRKDFMVNRLDKRITLTVPTPPEGTKSWALVGFRRDKGGNIKSKQLIIGENIDGAVKPVCFTFVSNKQ